MNHRAILAVLFTLGTIASTACAPRTPAARQSVFTWADSSELLSRVPCCEATVDKNTRWLLDQEFDGLVKFAPGTANIIPNLATQWEVSAEGRTWTFHLRPGVTFSDGSALTAQDVKYSIDLAQQSTVARLPMSTFQSVDAPDDQTVTISTSVPDSTVPFALEGGLVQSRKSTPDSPIGTGPYVLKEWNRGENVVLEKRTNYWGAAPTIEKLVYLKRPEPTTRLVQLSKGEVDMAKLLPEDIPTLKNTPGVRVETPESSLLVGSRLNLRTPPYDKREVRQALNYAINKQELVNNLLLGAGYVPDAIAGRGVWATVRLDGGYYPYDPAKAETLLGQAGLVKTAGKWNFNGRPLVFRFFTPEGRYLKDRQVAEYVSQQLDTFGVTVSLEIVPWTVWAANSTKKAIAGEIDGGLNGYSLLHPVLNYGNMLLCSNKDRGETGYCNPSYDTLFSTALTSFVEQDQLDAYAKAQRILIDDAVWLLLYGQNPVWGIRDQITGINFTPNEIPLTAEVRTS